MTFIKKQYVIGIVLSVIFPIHSTIFHPRHADIAHRRCLLSCSIHSCEDNKINKYIYEQDILEYINISIVTNILKRNKSILRYRVVEQVPI